MEVFAAVMHRLVMHGPGHRWHRFHHGPATKSLDANDWFPVLFATATIAVIFVGSRVDELSFLMWIGAGITAYGAAYLIVHDICTHGRFVGAPIGNRGYLGYVRHTHRVHHLGGRAPYGFLLPVRAAAMSGERRCTACRVVGPERQADQCGRGHGGLAAQSTPTLGT